MHIFLTATMASAGYPQHLYSDCSTRKVPYTANINCIRTSDNEQLLDNFMDTLFKVRASHFTKHGRLRPVLERYLASILINHEEISMKYGLANYVVSMVERCALDLKISLTVLKDWGKIIKEDEVLNTIQIKSNDLDSLLIIEMFKNTATQAKRDHLEVLREIKLQNREIDNLKETVVNLEKIIKSSSENNSAIKSSPQKKSPINKQQIDELDEEADTEQKVNEVLSKIQQPTFIIKTMKGLLLKTLLYNYFFFNLKSGATWEVETVSSSQDKSKLVSVFIPMMLKEATKEELHVDRIIMQIKVSGG